MAPPPALPLEGLRILAVSQLGAGPFGLMTLADLGAEVIKIENREAGGDAARYVPPFAEEADSLYFQSLNRNNRSLALDLGTPGGREVFEELAKRSQGVFSNLRGGQAKELGLDYDSLRNVNPRIVCCSLTGFGEGGPRSKEPAYDYLLQAYAGIMALTGEPDGPPTKCSVSFVDFAGGLTAALAMMIALYAVEKTGQGTEVDVSLLGTAAGMLNYLAIWTLNRGYEPKRLRESAHPSIVPCQNFQTRDGWILVMAMKEKFWERLCGAVGKDEFARDPRYSSFASRLENRDELVSTLQRIFRGKTTDEWLRILRGRVPCAPVYTVSEALQDEQVTAQDLVIEVDHPRFGLLREIACAIRFPGTSQRKEPAPALGADTEAILRDLLGYGIDRIRQLREEGVI